MSTAIGTRPHRPELPSREVRGAPWSVVLAIARVEGVRMLRHPATVVGTVLATALATTELWPHPPVLHRDVPLLATCALLLAAGVLLAASLAGSRIVRDDVDPLVTVAASSTATRTCGVLLGLLWPAAGAALWCSAGTGVLAMAGGVGRPAVADVLAPAGTVLVAGAVGVFVGRWFPWAFAGIVALPLMASGLVIGSGQTFVRRPALHRLMPWSDWSPGGAGWIEMWPRAPGHHLAYVVLLAATIAGFALLRDRRHLGVIAFVVGCAAGAGLLAGQLLAVWDEPERVAALVRDVQDPASRLRCQAQDGVEVCVPDGYGAWDPDIREQVLAAWATLPAHVPPGPVRVELQGQMPAALLASLPSHVVEDLPPDLRELAARPFMSDMAPVPQAGVVGLSHRRAGGSAGAAQRLDLALGVLGQETAVPLHHRYEDAQGTGDGLPGFHEGCAPDLTAAEVLTFALAALADPAARDALARDLDARPYGWVGPDGPVLFGAVAFDDSFELAGGATTSSALTGMTHLLGVTGPWSRGAATLGLRVADGVDDVRELHVDWDRWVDPATTADDLVDALGVDPLPSPAQLAVAAGIGDEYLQLDPRCT